MTLRFRLLPWSSHDQVHLHGSVLPEQSHILREAGDTQGELGQWQKPVPTLSLYQVTTANCCSGLLSHLIQMYEADQNLPFPCL